MRSFSALPLLALLASESMASPLRNRAVVIENVIVTHEIVVTKYADGFLKTAEPKIVGIETIPGPPVVETIVRPVSTIEDTPAPETSAPAPAAAPAIFQEAAKAPEPTTTAAPAAPSTTLAQAVKSSAPSTPSGAKRGIAYNDASFLSAFEGAKSVSWCYNWGGSTPTVPSNFEYVPMLWGLGEHANNWQQFADSAIASGSKHLLAFNEPDHNQQSSTDPGTAAAGYKQYMQPYAGKAKLGAPAVTNGGAPMGLAWLGSFMSACADCTIDFVPVHWYNGGDVAAFKAHMQSAYEVGGKRPIWITEFQAPGSPSEQIAFLGELLPWLDSQDWIERYSLFMASEGLMMSGNGLSDIGKAFIA